MAATEAAAAEVAEAPADRQQEPPEEPTAEAAKYEEPHTDHGTTCNETEQYRKARDKITETQEAYRQEQMRQMRKEIFCNRKSEHVQE